MTMPAHTADSTTALDALLRPVLPVAFRTAYHLSRNSTDAEDIVQEAALNACRSFHTFEEGSNFRAWFLRIVTNVFLMRSRRERRAGGQIPFDESLGSLEAESWGRVEEDPLAATLARIDSEEIIAALQELPRDYRTVAVLYFVEDHSYRDIARIVGCPVGTVRSRLHRARRHLTLRLRRLAADRDLMQGESRARAPRSVRRRRSTLLALAPVGA